VDWAWEAERVVNVRTGIHPQGGSEHRRRVDVLNTPQLTGLIAIMLYHSDPRHWNN